MPDRLTPEHWRNRAAEVRALADAMSDQESREKLLRIAQDYERLAIRAEERQRNSTYRLPRLAYGAQPQRTGTRSRRRRPLQWNQCAVISFSK